jgi:hypothetical protein
MRRAAAYARAVNPGAWLAVGAVAWVAALAAVELLSDVSPVAIVKQVVVALAAAVGGLL